MEQRVLKTLEYDKIIALLVDKASCTYGKEKAAELTPFVQLDEVKIAQQGTQEAATVLRLKGSAPLGGIRDIRSSVQRARLNAMLAPLELLDI
ncbi:endonuclease MutS2, partial [Mesorhizobium sp. M00.F.Ca.ET.186.01.1.1]